MPECPLTATLISHSTFLELTRELTIGQRSADTAPRLHAFLHRRIYPKLGDFSIELYLHKDDSNLLLPPISPDNSVSQGVPTSLPFYDKLLIAIIGSGQPMTLQSDDQLPDYLQKTGNATHLILPLLDRDALVGILYIGATGRQTFTPEYLTGLTTLTSIICSRLKSMQTIEQLKSSMHALEYSEQIRAALYEISEQAHTSGSLDDLYTSMHRIVSRLIYANNFIIALVEKRPNGTYYQFPYFVDQYDSSFQGQDIKLDPERKNLTSFLIENREPLLLTPANFDTICKEGNIHIHGTRPYSWLGAPFYLNNLSGAVIAHSYADVIYTDKDKRLMSFVARHVGDALGRRRTIDELRMAKERAEQAEKNKSNFLANMSHEIRTPMNGIIGMTDLTLDMTLPEKARGYLEMVRTSSDRLLGLINDILDFSKIEAGKLDLIHTPFRLRQDIAETLQLLDVNAAKKNITLSANYDDLIPEILVGDSTRLCQVITNLVANGIKFSEHGSVSLTARKTLTQSDQKNRLILHFQVRDTGVGIPADKIDTVFKAFSQIGTTLGNQNRGTGLGLVIAAELVQKMGGRIWIESLPEHGTTFHFTAEFGLASDSAVLPITRQKTAPVQPAISSSLRILLAEDDYINRTLATAVLERSGWKVETAENGHEVLTALGRVDNTFDLILMDIQMPEMNGFETTRIIREQEKATTQHTPIIAMTAYAVKGDREKCLDAGMDGYISKPIKPTQLHAEIENILQARLHCYH